MVLPVKKILPSHAARQNDIRGQKRPYANVLPHLRCRQKRPYGQMLKRRLIVSANTVNSFGSHGTLFRSKRLTVFLTFVSRIASHHEFENRTT